MQRQKVKGESGLKKAMTQIRDYKIDSQDEAPGKSREKAQKKSLEKKDDSMHKLILSEFKVKYDELQQQYQTKKKEADALLFKNKKLEVELLNQNVEYYEKEIVRLRQEVQKYQTENEDNRYKYMMAQNAKKDLEATSKVKQEQLKKALKQLEKEKITVVQLRHQLGEKDRSFKNILQEVQNSNQAISNKYDQAHSKVAKLESDIKIYKIELEQVKRENERKDRQLTNKRQQLEQGKEKHELVQYRLTHKLEDFQEDLREYKSKENEQIKRLQNKVTELEARCASQELLLAEKSASAEQTKVIRDKQIVIAGLEENIRELERAITSKNSEITNLKTKLQGVCPMSLLKENQDRTQQMANKYKATEQLLQRKVADLEKELSLAKQSKGNVQGQVKMTNNFQILLKDQIEENTKLKGEIASKIYEIYALKNSIEELNIKMSLLQNEIDILKKRSKADEKNSKIQYQIELQNLRNQVETLRRRLEMTQTKLGIKTKEVKDKDTFISNVLIGRSKQEDVPFVINELKRIFEADYMGKLHEANLRIGDLQSKLSAQQ